jgi:hypothetical protein
MEEHEHQEPDEVMDPKRFLDHTVQVHMNRKRLTAIFDAKQHWVFAMTAECGSIVLALNQLHQERCGDTIPMIVACCVNDCPAFFLFPKAHLAFYEIGELLDIDVAGSQAQAEQMAYFTLAMQDPTPLSDALAVWVDHDPIAN